MTSAQEEEENNEGTTGRPNAYWAEVRTEGGGFGGNFRGVPSPPKGGTATVKPEDVLGDEQHCWCGEPEGHDWPGKAKRRPHPRKKDESVPTMTSTIAKKDVASFPDAIQEYILKAVNEVGLRFKMTSANVLLFPPDGTAPLKIFPRNGEHQMNKMASWWRAHVESVIDTEVHIVASPQGKRLVSPKPESPAEKPMTDDEIAAAAAMLQRKVAGPEHVVPPKPRPAATKPPRPPAKVVVEDEPAVEPVWVPYVSTRGTPTNALTDGTRFKCGDCDQMLNGNTSITGHNRTHHSDTSTLWGPEAKAQASETARMNNLRKKVEKSIKALAASIDMDISGGDTKALQAEVAKISKALDKAQTDLEKSQVALAKVTEERDEAKARLALMKEALSA